VNDLLSAPDCFLSDGASYWAEGRARSSACATDHRHNRQSRTSSWRLRLADSRQERKAQLCSNGLTGAEVQVRLAMGVRGESLETDPRGELLDRAELAVCLDIIGASRCVYVAERIAGHLRVPSVSVKACADAHLVAVRVRQHGE